MLHFYGEVLQLPEAGKIPFPDLGLLHKFQCAENIIKILVLHKPAERGPVAGGFTAAVGFRYCGLALNNLDETLLRVRNQGVVIANEPLQLRPGVRVAVILDPDGNMIELFEEQ
jgi:catechol 2,3-dioxygenase-like lactoylglutathione lyase family enzyme